MRSIGLPRLRNSRSRAPGSPDACSVLGSGSAEAAPGHAFSSSPIPECAVFASPIRANEVAQTAGSRAAQNDAASPVIEAHRFGRENEVVLLTAIPVGDPVGAYGRESWVPV
jgi:hypothetical protein